MALCESGRYISLRPYKTPSVELVTVLSRNVFENVKRCYECHTPTSSTPAVYRPTRAQLRRARESTCTALWSALVGSRVRYRKVWTPVGRLAMGCACAAGADCELWAGRVMWILLVQDRALESL